MAARKAKKSDAAKPQPIIAYKAFDENMQCRGFQYEVGKTYIHEGDVKACESGFHSCTNPLDVLNYYDLSTARFAVVEVDGKVSKEECGDSKIASAQISIKAELTLPSFIKSAIDYLFSACAADEKVTASSGNRSKLASSGDWSQLASSGDWSQLASSGDGSKLASSGDGSKLASSGDGSVVGCAAYECTASAGENSCISLAWHDGERPRISVAYVGENGIKPNTPYRLDDKGNFVEVSQ